MSPLILRRASSLFSLLLVGAVPCLGLGVGLGGCASPGTGGRVDLFHSDGGGTFLDFTAGPADLTSKPQDLTGADLAGADLSGVDLATVDLRADLAAADLASAPDLKAPVDLTVVVDLLAPADLVGRDTAVPPPDLVVVPDQTVPQDLAAATPDLVVVPDLTVVPDLKPPPADMTTISCVPQTNPCDWVCQNCSNGNKCTLDGSGAPICQADGTVPTNGTCTPDNCSKGNVCINQSSLVPINTCMQFCRTDADCKNTGKCIWSLTGGSMVCSDPINGCDPVAKTGCTNGLGCYANTLTGVDTGCHFAGSGGTGAVCETDYDCKPGWACFDIVFFGGPSCMRLCHSGNDGDCNSELFFPTCNGISGWNNYGICYL